jgi:hypothetical protein
MDDRTCPGCRHYVANTNTWGGACHGPGAWIYSPKLGEWIQDRGMFARAAAMAGLYRYQWSGRWVGPGCSCAHHQTAAEATAEGVPIHERLERSSESRRISR